MWKRRGRAGDSTRYDLIGGWRNLERERAYLQRCGMQLQGTDRKLSREPLFFESDAAAFCEERIPRQHALPLLVVWETCGRAGFGGKRIRRVRPFIGELEGGTHGAHPLE